MKQMSPWKTVRGRLLLLAIGLETLMLAVLITNSIRLLHSAMSNQVQAQAYQFSPVLIAALTAPLASRDYATMQAVVDESQAKGGLDYIVVVDRYGHRIAANGWSSDVPLPESSKDFSLFESKDDPRYDVIVPIEFQRQPLGKLHFGINLSQIVQARKTLLVQGIGIATIEITLSSALLLCLGFWLTRHMKSLTMASLEVASGNLSPPPVPEGSDDVGQLGAAFNIMSRVIAERVSELTIAKELAEASEAQLRGITDSANDAILMMNPQGTITYWNPAAEQILGFSLEEALGQNLHLLVIPERYQAAHIKAFHDFLRTGTGKALGKTLELFAKRKDGREIAVALSLSAVLLHGEWHAVGILRDITERKQHEHELEQAREAAEAANRAKSEFLANMSHEIRTPMNAIIGMSYLVLQSDLTSAQREQISCLHNAAESLLGILNDILDFSKVEAGKLLLEQSPFALKDVLNECIQLIKPSLHDKSIEFDLKNQNEILTQNTPLLVGDALRVRQILVNLLSNAIKFTKHGFVRLGVTSIIEENIIRVVFTIEDSGIGMDIEQIEHLFEKFGQADASTTRRYGGTGLGLAITAKFVALMGGSIDVQSQPGIGSCFTVEIPFAIALTDGAPLHERRKSIENIDALQGVRVLLVEDNPVNRKVAFKALELAGIIPDVAEHGEQAVQMLQSLPIDTYGAVLMDLQMPVMDGYEATQLIRKDRRFDSLPIIALTTRVMEFEKEKGLQTGMNGFVHVPFDPKFLWQTLLRAVRKRESFVAPPTEISDQGFTDLIDKVEDNIDTSESGTQGIQNKDLFVNAMWLEEFIDRLGKGDFTAVELWADNKHLLGDRLFSLQMQQIDRALQQFDFTLALELITTKDSQ